VFLQNSQVKADRTGYSSGGKIDFKNRYWIGDGWGLIVA
jgi:hypothetical protein